ncbi:TetR family transcriptional regulator C-terminal domain-containing protein [Streptomyces sp. C10]|uniref:TetR family transcriptional regulator C-terminal domain-containing protein n=1 Tax=Streptomyces sp. C10 TaxID=531941 RepID=UPI00397F19E1
MAAPATAPTPLGPPRDPPRPRAAPRPSSQRLAARAAGAAYRRASPSFPLRRSISATAKTSRASTTKPPTRRGSAGGLRPGLCVETETERLTSLLDGLAFAAVLRPEVLDAPACATVLRAHLDDLGPAAG